MKLLDIIVYTWGVICLIGIVREYMKSVVFRRRLKHKNVRVTLELYDGTIVSFKPNSDKIEDIREMIQAFEKLLPRKNPSH